MSELQTKNALKTTRACVIIACIAVILAMAVWAVAFSLTKAPGGNLSKEEILANIAEVSEGGKECKTVADYLIAFGFFGFDSVKFKAAENFFEEYSIYELESKKELAAKTANLFINLYYDTTDLSDQKVFTDMLITCFVEATGDKYAVYRTKDEYEDYNTNMSGSFVGIGVYVRYNQKENTVQVLSLMEDSAALGAGVLPGDYLYAVDGKTLEELGYNEFISSIRGEVGTSVTVTVLRGEEYIDITVVRKKITEKTVSYSINEEKIGYLKLTGFKANTASQFKDAIADLEAQGCVGIIFDLRDNPGGYLTSVVEVIDRMVPKGTRIASYTDTDGEVVYTAKSDEHIKVPIVVIFNEGTASAGELFSAAMRDYNDMDILRCVTVGENTYSKGVMQNTGNFKDGSSLTLTIAYYNPPCNVNYDGVGVKPDVAVEWSTEGDLQLDRAYMEIAGLIN